MAQEKLLSDSSLLPKGRIVLLGMYKNDTPEALKYELILVTMENGRLTNVAPLDTCYSDSDAINAATGWLDSNYYDA